MFKFNDKHNQQALFESTHWMDPKILKKLEKSWAPIFYEHVFCKIDEEPFAALYDTTGKPNFPVNILLSLEYIKHMKNCNDLELIDSYNFDYLVNYAVGNRTLGELNLATRTLYYFRQRIYLYCLENPGEEDILFDQFIKLLQHFSKEAGISMEEQRTDTTLFKSNIKKAGRMSLAYDVLIKSINAIPQEKQTQTLIQAQSPKFKTDTLYRTKAGEKESRLTILLTLCQEALTILETIPNKKEPEEVRILKRFLTEQSTHEAETGKLIPQPKKEIPSGSLQSAYDEDATYRTKRNTSQSGYVLDLSETCSKDNPFQLLTDYTVEPNNTNDAKILEERLPIIQKNTGCTDMYADGGFHSENVHEIAKDNNITIHLTDMTGTEPTKKLPVSAYEIDETTNIIITCPAGHTPLRANISKSQTTAHFPKETCANCEFQEHCHSKEQTKENVVRIDLKSVKASREREKIKANQKENTSKRAGIEGSNSALKRTGQDKLKVRGQIKSTLVSGLKVTVQNIKRMTKYIQGGYKPKKNNPPSNGIPVPIS